MLRKAAITVAAGASSLKHGTRTAIRIVCAGNAGPVTESSLSIDVYTAIRFLRLPEDKAIGDGFAARSEGKPKRLHPNRKPAIGIVGPAQCPSWVCAVQRRRFP